MVAAIDELACEHAPPAGSCRTSRVNCCLAPSSERAQFRHFASGDAHMHTAGICVVRLALSMSLAATLAAMAAGSLFAQQADPPPPWKQGQPASIANSKLAPIAPPPVPTAADKLPIDKLNLKAGYRIEVYAAGVPNARTLRLGDKGTVFVSSRLQDKVHAIVTKDGKREVKVVASGLHRPNGIALHKGTLYIAELSQISKIDNVEDKLDNPPKPTVIFSDLPKDDAPGWKFLTVGPDEKLYFQVGAPCNVCIPSEQHTKIYRVGLDGKGLEVYASGIRQIVG